MKLRLAQLACLLIITLTNLQSSHQAVLDSLLEERFERVRLIKGHIADVFHKIGHQPNATILHSIFPHAAEMLSKKVLKMEKCYLSSVKGGVYLDIFKEPMALVVYKYLKAYSLSQEGSGPEWLQNLKTRIENLVGNIKEVAGHVIECMKNVDTPAYEPTKLALNRYSSLSVPEFFKLRHPKPLPRETNLVGSRRGSVNVKGGHPSNVFKRPHFHPIAPGPITKFAKKVHGGFGGRHIAVPYETFEVDDINNSRLPESFDYRDQGVVSVVKNQGGAMTCYLFAATSAIESAYMLTHPNKRNVSFSEKDAYNCLARHGYNEEPHVGGQVETVFRMFLEKHGLVHERNAEPYDFKRKDYETPPVLHIEKCLNLPRSQEAVRVKGFAKEDALDGGEKGLLRLKKILFKYGPVTTVFRAPQDSRWLQLAGEMNFECNKTAAPLPDHAMLVTGWTPQYLIIKNSYGNYEDADDRWGKAGYLYLNNKYLENCAVLGNVSQILVPSLDE